MSYEKKTCPSIKEFFKMFVIFLQNFFTESTKKGKFSSNTHEIYSPLCS